MKAKHVFQKRDGGVFVLTNELVVIMWFFLASSGLSARFDNDDKSAGENDILALQNQSEIGDSNDNS